MHTPKRCRSAFNIWPALGEALSHRLALKRKGGVRLKVRIGVGDRGWGRLSDGGVPSSCQPQHA